MIEYGTAQPVGSAVAQLGECPLWSVAEQALYWVDISGRAIHRFNPGTRAASMWPMPSEPGCMALAESGGLIVALRHGFCRFDPVTGAVAKIADAPYDPAQYRFNDGRCDAAGRFFAGAMFEARTHERASMFVLENGCVREAWGPGQGWGVKVSNGLAFSADGKTLFQSDTPNHVIHQFDYDAARGAVSNRREFARRPANRSDPDYGGRPDGAAIDVEGCYWSAQFEGAQVLRYSRDGDVIGRVSVAARRTTMVAFGGKDLQTMFITTAREGATEDEVARFPNAGRLFAIRLPMAGRAEPLYRD
ncbi:MAG: SMP-30/gluconolactonase/LRE family protein [Betaproteobacteria bacterium]|nr:SMP-30/gluconolactonase/LRE family protein [Betaproteobacteria bacterium]